MELPSSSTVLVLLVVTDGAKWLPEVLDALRAQDHRPVDILAVDNASTDGSSELLVSAFGARRVITLERRAGYGRALAAALKVAADRGSTADAFLLLHDDAALEPGALTAMVDEMRRGDAGIVGAKLVEWEDPSRLQDVGQTADRNARVVAHIERDELDHGQYEGVRDVLFATSAAMLVYRDVVARVGLFDLRYVALRDDLDLCWRARMAGWRTVVTTAAVARHASAGIRGQRRSSVARRARYFAERNALATMIKNYSGARLATRLPVAVFASLASAVLYLATGKRSAAAQVLEALQWNVVHLPSTLRARVRAQRTRTASDADISLLMDHSATRLRAQVERALETIAPLDESAPEERRSTQWIRAHPGAAIGIVAVAVWLIGARTIFSSTPLAGIDMAPFPSSWHAFFAEFTSGWRGAGHGGATPSTPGLLVFGALSLICFGSGRLAQSVLLAGLPLVAAIGMLRLARAIGLSRPASRVSVVAYAASPLVLGLFASGRLPDLILAAFAPMLLLPLLRAAQIAPPGGWHDDLVAIAGLAFVVSLAPWALVMFAGAAAVLSIATRTREPLRRGFIAVAGALVLLFPWSTELFRAGSPLGAGGAESGIRMRELLGLNATHVHAIPWVLTYGLGAAAITGALAARDDRRRLAARFVMLGSGALVAAWASSRSIRWIAPRAALPLIVTALAACVLAGIAYESARPALRGRAFGGAHVIAGLLGIALVVQLGASAVFVATGDHRGMSDAGELAPSLYSSDTARAGTFRVAWIGGTDRAPTIDLTGPEGETARSYLARPAGKGADAMKRALAAIVGGATESGGRLLATFGVRYVVLRPDADPQVAQAVARQTDLAFFQRLHGARIFRDDVGLSIATAVESSGWISAAGSGLESAAGAETHATASAGFVRRGATTYEGSATKRSPWLLLAEDLDSGWRARVGETQIAPGLAFGWSMRFRVPPGSKRIDIQWTGHRKHLLAILLEIVMIIAFAAAWSRRAARERGER